MQVKAASFTSLVKKRETAFDGRAERKVLE